MERLIEAHGTTDTWAKAVAIFSSSKFSSSSSTSSSSSSTSSSSDDANNANGKKTALEQDLEALGSMFSLDANTSSSSCDGDGVGRSASSCGGAADSRCNLLVGTTSHDALYTKLSEVSSSWSLVTNLFDGWAHDGYRQKIYKLAAADRLLLRHKINSITASDFSLFYLSFSFSLSHTHTLFFSPA